VSNLQAHFTSSLVYTGPSDEEISVSLGTVVCPYQASTCGHLDVPIGTPANTVNDVPILGTTAATLLIFSNHTGQEILMTINGADFTPPIYDLPDGASCVLIAGPSVAAVNPISQVSFKNLADQLTAGHVSYYCFGDPV
jgi:hypothetical protein